MIRLIGDSESIEALDLSEKVPIYSCGASAIIFRWLIIYLFSLSANSLYYISIYCICIYNINMYNIGF